MISRNCPGRRTTEATGRRLLEIVVYGKCCRVGGNADSGRSCRDIGGRRLEDARLQAGLFLRGVSRLDDRSGRCADADHSGIGGGLIVQTSNLSRVSGACRNARASRFRRRCASALMSSGQLSSTVIVRASI